MNMLDFRPTFVQKAYGQRRAINANGQIAGRPAAAAQSWHTHTHTHTLALPCESCRCPPCCARHTRNLKGSQMSCLVPSRWALRDRNNPRPQGIPHNVQFCRGHHNTARRNTLLKIQLDFSSWRSLATHSTLPVTKLPAQITCIEQKQYFQNTSTDMSW